MTLHANVSGTWQTISDPQAKVSGTWRPVQQVYIKASGSWQLVYSRFTPVTHTYTPTNGHPALDRELVPENATHLRITCQGGGGAGGASTGGGGGGYSVKDVAISSSDWPSSSAHYLTLDGTYPVGGDAGAFEAGSHARVAGTLAVGAIDMSGNGGAFAGAGGTATGGDTNTSGSAGSGSGSGAGAAGGGAAEGQGGDRDLNADGFGGNGADGYWKFEWT